MSTGSGVNLELTQEERQFLELIYEHFDRELNWPEPAPIKRQLYQRGFHDVDIDSLLARLAPTLVREAELGGTRLRLTLAGLRAIYRTVEATDFICLLRMAVDKYGELNAAKTFATEDLVKRCGLDSKRLRKLDALVQAEPFIARPTCWTPEREPLEWEVSDEVTRYREVFDTEGYLVSRRREIEKLADSDIPPIHLLAAEGIPVRRSVPFAASPPIEFGPVASEVNAPDSLAQGRHPSIEKEVRPQFEIGKYDLGVFAALKAVEVRVRALAGFGNDLVGVELMNRAFGSGGPLTDRSLPRGEQEGMRALFAGTYAVLRNPTGHREIDYEDVQEAVDGAHAASLLMRILDRIETRRGLPPTA